MCRIKEIFLTKMRKLLAVIMLFAGLWVRAGAVPEKGRKESYAVISDS